MAVVLITGHLIVQEWPSPGHRTAPSHSRTVLGIPGQSQAFWNSPGHSGTGGDQINQDNEQLPDSSHSGCHRSAE